MTKPVSHKISITCSLLLTAVLQTRPIICICAFALCCGTLSLQASLHVQLSTACHSHVRSLQKLAIKNHFSHVEVHELQRKKVIFLSYPQYFNMVFRSHLKCHAGNFFLDKFFFMLRAREKKTHTHTHLPWQTSISSSWPQFSQSWNTFSLSTQSGIKRVFVLYYVNKNTSALNTTF